MPAHKFTLNANNLKADKKPEFNNWKWVEPIQICDQIVNFKKHIYKKILEEFKLIMY